MLVLTRSLGSKVYLELPDGSEIVVTMVSIKNGKARVGFDAPAKVHIVRSELRENDQGAKAGGAYKVHSGSAANLHPAGSDRQRSEAASP